MSAPRFSLVIPCYNEAAGLPELLTRCRFTAHAGSGEVVLVDNGSSDDTAAVLERELGPAGSAAEGGGVRWVQVAVNRGYGFGIVSGLRVCDAPVIGWTHADLQADPADALRALDRFEPGARTIVKGRRLGRPAVDVAFTIGMSIFESLLLRSRLNDINAQPTMFSRELIDVWGTPPDDFSLDLFALYTARRRGFQVRRVPVLFVPRKFGSSSWNTDWSAKKKFIKRTVGFSLALRKSL
ncbi:glycosyltransferase family 2 protein [Amnibacterium flavum]|uniref:Glycosyl transferase family 2 n=1 Tax=Amnibacterium flavum TaxID=2173173 RepID=A0A2V1HYI3_9MICO|nr:glycosyltransferase family 2 protein [Amnibacterium flavum]PVZ95857.1 glycosyl transferase family 2 [Amnibacterium flavum]